MASKKHAYFFGSGKAEAKGKELTKDFLGGKGIGLMEMTSIGLPVPAGFTTQPRSVSKSSLNGSGSTVPQGPTEMSMVAGVEVRNPSSAVKVKLSAPL